MDHILETKQTPTLRIKLTIAENNTQHSHN